MAGGSGPHETSSVCTYDVTKVFEDTCKALEVGEMLESSAFDLQQAMTALEIGDAKMDVGLQRTDMMTAGQRVSQGEAPLDLSEDQILVVMDRLIQLEACWHEQFMLPQTVYTCLYMVDLDRCGFCYDATSFPLDLDNRLSNYMSVE